MLDIIQKRIGLDKAAPDRPQSWLIQRLLSDHFGGTRSSVIGNLVNAMVVAYILGSPENRQMLWLGAAALTAIMARRLWLSTQLDQAGNDTAKLLHLHRKIFVNSCTLASWWGLAIFFIMLVASPAEALLGAILAAGMTAAGALTYREVPQAARAFVGICAVGSAAGLFSVGTSPAYASGVLLLSFTGVLFVSINRTYANIIQQYQRASDLQQSADTINMLLTDFTEQGSDCMLELDSDNRVVNPSERLAEMLQRPLEAVEGVDFLELFHDGEDTAGLRDHLENRRAFRNHAVCTDGVKEPLCWSISARPVRDDEIVYRGVITDITAQRKAEKRVNYMAHFDALTDLPNRFQFQQRLSSELQRGDGQLALLFADLDEFKSINDTLGHTAGDLMLKRVAERLRDCVQDDEIVARLGGDEFAILMPQAERARVDELCHCVIESFAQPFSLDGQEVIAGTSIGVAISPDHGRDAQTLLMHADLALYEAKSAGRNRHAYFKDGMDVAAQNRRDLEQDLRKALTQDELRLHYQPLVAVDTGKINGYEALIRWEHPERGVVMPGEFIAIAEDSGLIIPIGEWVIRQALDDMSSWPEDRDISINLSPAQMRSPSLITTVVQALANTQVAAGRVCLEITESVLMHDSDANIATLHKLRELGLRIALDDFGTGYSSLNYLRSFPFDKIKIDRCFISEIDSRDDCQAIVRSVVNLANSLGMTTTAEGVERADQLELLRGEGCQEVQGYLYSKALPQGQLTDLRLPIRSKALKLAEIERIRGDGGDGGGDHAISDDTISQRFVKRARSA